MDWLRFIVIAIGFYHDTERSLGRREPLRLYSVIMTRHVCKCIAPLVHEIIMIYHDIIKIRDKYNIYVRKRSTKKNHISYPRHGDIIRNIASCALLHKHNVTSSRLLHLPCHCVVYRVRLCNNKIQTEISRSCIVSAHSSILRGCPCSERPGRPIEIKLLFIHKILRYNHTTCSRRFSSLYMYVTGTWYY